MILRQGFKKAPITGKTSRRRRKSLSFQETKTQAKLVIQDLRDLAKQSIRKTLRDQQGLFHQDLEMLEHSIDTESFRVGVVGVFFYRGKNVVAREGEINLAIPGESHDGFAAEEHGWRYRMLYVSTDLVSRAVSEVTDKP